MRALLLHCLTKQAWRWLKRSHAPMKFIIIVDVINGCHSRSVTVLQSHLLNKNKLVLQAGSWAFCFQRCHFSCPVSCLCFCYCLTCNEFGWYYLVFFPSPVCLYSECLLCRSKNRDSLSWTCSAWTPSHVLHFSLLAALITARCDWCNSTLYGSSSSAAVHLRTCSPSLSLSLSPSLSFSLALLH